MMTLFKVLFKNRNLFKANKRIRYLQIGTAALQSFTHGTNDAQKAMGIITMALIAGELAIRRTTFNFGFELLQQLQWDLVLLLVAIKLLKLSVEKS